MVQTRTMAEVIADHDFFAGTPAPYLQLLGGCAKTHHFKTGQLLCREGDPADEFFIIRSGHVAIETHAASRDIIIHTSGPHEIVGVSWLMPPYRCLFDARATDEVQTIAFDAACLRRKCDADPALGYDLLTRFSAALVRRMQDARAQAMDLYRQPSGETTILRAPPAPNAPTSTSAP